MGQQANADGAYSIAIGASSGTNDSTKTNTICIGQGTTVTGSNMCRIGNDDIKVGIGTSSPIVKLQVAVTPSFDAFAASVFDTDGTYVSDIDHKASDYATNHGGAAHDLYSGDYNANGDNQSYDQDNHTSAFFEGSIMVKGRVYMESDKRAKHNINIIDDDKALKLVRNIQCYSYYYNDIITRDTGISFGFLAQEVKEELSSAVRMKKEFLPEAMTFAQNISWEDLSNNTFKLTIPVLRKDLSGNITIFDEGTRFKFYLADSSGNVDFNEHFIGTLLEDKKSFILPKKSEKVFIYGYEVEDFHVLDKEKIFTVHHSAIQEIDKIQQAEKIKVEELQKENSELKTEIETLKTQMSDILSRLTAGGI